MSIRWMAPAVGAALLASLAATVAAQVGEKKVTIDAVPAAVKAAVLEQVRDGKLVDIGVYERDAKTGFRRNRSMTLAT